MFEKQPQSKMNTDFSKTLDKNGATHIQNEDFERLKFQVYKYGQYEKRLFHTNPSHRERRA